MILHPHMKFRYQGVQIDEMIRNMQSICMKITNYTYFVWSWWYRYETWKKGEKRGDKVFSFLKILKKAISVKMKCKLERGLLISLLDCSEKVFIEE